MDAVLRDQRAAKNESFFLNLSIPCQYQVANSRHGTINTGFIRFSHHAFIGKHLAMKQIRRLTWPFIRLVVASLTVTICIPQNSFAQDPDNRSLHWAYASYFGTGWYSVGDNRDAYVLRMTPRWEYREASLDDVGDRAIGINFKFPVTVGLDTLDFTNLPGAVEPDNLASLSVTPGIDIEIPVTQRFTLRPYLAVGWGVTTNGNESAWTYWTGIRSRYAFQSGKLDWALLNSISYVGYTPNEGTSEDFWPLMIGLEFNYPLGKAEAKEGSWILHWHGTYTSFENDLDFLPSDIPEAKPITDEWELGIAFRRKDQRIRIWFMNFDRLGLAFRTSSDGELRGIAFIFRSRFDL